MAESVPNPKQSITVTLLVEGSGYVGTVDDAFDRTICVSFPRGTAPFLPLRRPVKLLAQGRPVSEPLDLQATPRSWYTTERGDQVYFDVDEDSHVELMNAIVRNRSVRIPLRGERAVRVGVARLCGDLYLESALVDISETGAGVIVSEKTDGLLSAAMLADPSEDRGRSLELAFSLPDGRGEVRVVAELRYRRLAYRCVKYGLRFDGEATRARFGPGALDAGSIVEAYRVRKAA